MKQWRNWISTSTIIYSSLLLNIKHSWRWDLTITNFNWSKGSVFIWVPEMKSSQMGSMTPTVCLEICGKQAYIIHIYLQDKAVFILLESSGLSNKYQKCWQLLPLKMSKPQVPCATLQVCLGQVLYGFFVHNEADKLLTNLNYPFNDYTYISAWWIMSSIKELIHLSIKGSFIQCHPYHSSMLALQIIDRAVRVLVITYSIEVAIISFRGDFQSCHP